jgi:hypothetical protein
MPKLFRLTTLTMLSLCGLCVAGLAPAVAAAAQEGLTPAEEKRIIREIDQKERELARFRAQIRKLESAARRSSNSSRRSAVEALESTMGETIVAAEEALGEDYRITKHGSDVDQVRTWELEQSKGVRTRNRIWISQGGENAPPPAYLRLMRQQAIFVSCKTVREQAIAAQNGVLDRYSSLVEEFALLLEDEIVELRAQLPDPEPEEAPGAE